MFKNKSLDVVNGILFLKKTMLHLTKRNSLKSSLSYKLNIV